MNYFFDKIAILLRQLRCLPYTLYFNFHYLPFKQAIKLPIILYKSSLIKCKGRIIIESNKIWHSMIILGKHTCSIYPNSGITYENNGGTLVFKGKCLIGSDSFISIGPKATVSIGDNFECNAALKLVSHYKIDFANDVSIGFENFIVDTDFHRLSCVENQFTKDLHKAYEAIQIGESCWLGSKCCTFKGTFLPDFCVVASCSMLNKKYNVPSYTLLAGIPATVKKNGIYRNRKNDKIIID